ncbi:MAG: CDP-diacylglycerol--serine O-phosphatidyltransferase [candidate division NC10 bacterium]|nr:CDP-diacylglycerol--serine O-phosphatidyltransferase [candidate division NC10 bacterium]
MKEAFQKEQVKRRMKRGVFLLPSLFTIANLLCGVYAIVAVYNDEYIKAAIAILVAVFLDGFDGAIARLTNSQSEFGIQLDSLADLVSFGVAPAILAYVWAIKPYGQIAWFFEAIVPTALFVSCAAFRLARFNIQTTNLDKRYFIGLPSPAAAITIASFVLLILGSPAGDGLSRQATSIMTVLMVYILAFFMVSRLRYRSLKGIEIKRRQPFALLIGLTLLLLLIASQPSVVLFAGSVTYVASGPIRLAFKRKGALEVSREAVTGERRV